MKMCSVRKTTPLLRMLLRFFLCNHEGLIKIYSLHEKCKSCPLKNDHLDVSNKLK